MKTAILLILNFFSALIDDVLGVVNFEFGLAFNTFFNMLYPAAIVPDVHAYATQSIFRLAEYRWLP